MARPKDTRAADQATVDTTAAAEATVETQATEVHHTTPTTTKINPRTGKIMNAEDRKKAEDKAAKEAAKKAKIREREEKRASKRAERDRKEQERDRRREELRAERARKEAEKDMDVAQRNAIADALLAATTPLGIKAPSFRKHVHNSGERVGLLDGAAVIFDARGANPISIAEYVEMLPSEVVDSFRKVEKKRRTGWPKREKSNRPKASDFTAMRLGDRPLAIDVQPGMPWSDFAQPRGVMMNVRDAVLVPNMVDYGNGQVKMVGMRLTCNSEDYGAIDREAARNFGRMVGFKVDFIDKLSSNPELACAAANHMVQDYRQQVLVFGGDEVIRDVFPGWREIAGHAEICQQAFNTMTAMYGDRVEVARCEVNANGHLDLELLVDLGTGAVSPAVGDYLKAGIKITHRYGTEVNVGLLTQRLACLNGMISSLVSYSWTSRETGTIAAQLAHVQEQVGLALSKFDGLLNNARRMVETPVIGDLHAILRERMKQMGIPPKHYAAIAEAFDLEPGQTEWHMLNAITRFATHTLGLGSNFRNAVLEGSGEWVSNFDVVHAHLPRSIATRVGAEIVAD